MEADLFTELMLIEPNCSQALVEKLYRKINTLAPSTDRAVILMFAVSKSLTAGLIWTCASIEATPPTLKPGKD